MARTFVEIFAVTTALVAKSPAPEQMAAIFTEYQRSNTPGCAAGVEIPKRDTWTAAYGMADLEHAVGNTPATVFEVGSVNKQFTASAVLLLVERGQISLDDDVRKYFPEIPAYDRPVTVRQLLNHTSGLRDWGEVENIAGWPRGTRSTHTRTFSKSSAASTRSITRRAMLGRTQIAATILPPCWWNVSAEQPYRHSAARNSSNRSE
jgi:CubicO group peptidase (beta-lactamase class C family)